MRLGLEEPKSWDGFDLGIFELAAKLSGGGRGSDFGLRRKGETAAFLELKGERAPFNNVPGPVFIM